MSDKKRLSELSLQVGPSEQGSAFDYLTKNLQGVAERLAKKLGKNVEQITFEDVSRYIHADDETQEN